MLGGGQLGKYAVIAANAMGYRTIVLDPDSSAPAAVVANEHIVAAFDDTDALARLVAACDVVTTEFENSPASSLEFLGESIQVAPSASCVAVAQDRIVEKAFMVEHGIEVGPHVAVRSGDQEVIDQAALARAADLADGGAVVKTARLGYDGKGQRRVSSRSELTEALSDLGDVDCVVEAMLDLHAEVSVIIGRTADGRSSHWPIAENVHTDGILDHSTVPAAIDESLLETAVEMATSIAEALDYVGVLAVEMFVVTDPRSNASMLFVNEIAPRPHNSGHWTLDASVTSQFEQQVRAVCGVGLGDTSLTAPAVTMANLLGDLWFAHGGADPIEPRWSEVLADPAATLHLYGKAEPRPGRKMGHLTVTAATPAEARSRAVALRSALTA